MIKLLLVAAAGLVLASCKKERTPVPLPVTTHPQMTYMELQDTEVKFLQSKRIDVDKDGHPDFSFSTLLVGDPVLQRDRLQFYVNSGVKRNLLNNIQDESPILNKFDSISMNHPGYTWWEISAIVLAEKITDNNGSYWQGLWKNADHKYLPIQVNNYGKIYNGWIEISFNSSEEKLILHRLGLSREENRTVQAGV